MNDPDDVVTQEKPSRIIGLQFSVMSPEEILRNSVAEILTKDTYVNNNVPVLNGLFDPRMGTQESNMTCPTDGHNYLDCPGYFGHIKLHRPVFYIQYINIVFKILRCVCFKCSKLLINKAKYQYLLRRPAEVRWDEVYAIASKIKRCGEDTEDGCSCKQPTKIRRSDLATIIAEWETKPSGEDEEQSAGAGEEASTSTPNKITMKITPDIALKIFRRISNDDVMFMGFNPVWARPEWFICQVLAIPPPNVRPSVKHDGNTRAEDDMTVILFSIFKANERVGSLIAQNANESTIENHVLLLQYYIATQIDNKLPGSTFTPVIQRSGRPMRSLKERLNGKGGRIRQNLMGKRVDFSARSVITAEPNISIGELGVPLTIAKNITRPVRVNAKNRDFLTRLVRNGPHTHPGAKMIDRVSSGVTISLSYIDLNSVVLDDGDVVHRHTMDGDYVLFNRQPTLHRMSMMAHKVRVMQHGNSFRMNVAVTQPYNADFDGDEMNEHMPQDDISETELRHIAAIKHNIISPATGKPIIGIFQDSLVGSTSITREGVKFDVKHAMNLMVNLEHVDMRQFNGDIKQEFTNFQVLSNIMPPITLKKKTKAFEVYKTISTESANTNGEMHVVNGRYIKGQLVKGALDGASHGLLHRIYRDCGKDACVQFIDDLQFIVNEYMKTAGYSVGISDLIWNKATQKQVEDVIAENKEKVMEVINQTHLGIFKNETNNTNQQHLENEIMGKLNQTVSKIGQIAQKTLGIDNRFVFMSDFLSGSKGKSVNISQMIACLGQQAINNGRVPYGYDNRSLPHFKKYDDSPEARGFIVNSFISGLEPHEAFYHALSGRIGLIDTAVRTSETGYIQRRLIKAMEDIKIEWDMTARNHKGKIVQFVYGGDSFDTTAIESQKIAFMEMSIEEIYKHFYFADGKDAKEDRSVLKHAYTPEAHKRLLKQGDAYRERINVIVEEILEQRPYIATNVMHEYFNDDAMTVKMPVNFGYIIGYITNQAGITQSTMLDITPLEVFDKIEQCYAELAGNKTTYVVPSLLFKLLYFHYLSPKQLLLKHHINKVTLDVLLDFIKLTYKKAIVQPGEMVGIVSAQSVGEPTTQMTLNTFHNAGVADKANVTTGVPRLQEIFKITETPAKPAMVVYMLGKDTEATKKEATRIMKDLEYVTLKDIIQNVSIYYDPKANESVVSEDNAIIQQYNNFIRTAERCAEMNTSQSPPNMWVMRLKMDPHKMLAKDITMDDVYYVLNNGYGDFVTCVYSDYNHSNLVFRLKVDVVTRGRRKTKTLPLNTSDEIHLLKSFSETLLTTTVLKGMRKVKKAQPRRVCDAIDYVDGKYSAKEIWVLDTVGSNLRGMLANDQIDSKRTISNDIIEVKNVLGIEAARQVIMNEMVETFRTSGSLQYHHLSLLVDRMTYSKRLIQIYRHGILSDDIGPIAKASFEQTPQNFIEAAMFGMLDEVQGVSANVMCGQEGNYGTNMSQVLLDMEKMNELSAKKLEKTKPLEEKILQSFDDIDLGDANVCSKKELDMHSTFNDMKKMDVYHDDEYDIDL